MISSTIDEGFGSQFDPADPHPLDISDIDIQIPGSNDSGFQNVHGPLNNHSNSLRGVGGPLQPTMDLQYANIAGASQSFNSVPHRSSGSTSSEFSRKITDGKQGHNDSPTDPCASPDAYDYRIGPLEQSFGQLLHENPARVSDIHRSSGSPFSFSVSNRLVDVHDHDVQTKRETPSYGTMLTPTERVQDLGSGFEDTWEGKVPRMNRPAGGLQCGICNKVVHRHCDMK